MEQIIKTRLRTALGVFLIVLGIAGMILPILPGIWFIPLGLQLLGWKIVIDRKKPWSQIISFKDKNKKEE